MDSEVSCALDLDGVYADYETGIENWGFVIDRDKKFELNRSNSQNPLKRQMYEAIKGTKFFRELPLMPDSQALWNRVRRYKTWFLTAAPKFGATEDDFHLNPYWCGAAFNKRLWLEEKALPNLMPTDHIEEQGYKWDFPISHAVLEDDRFVCTTSARKAEYINRFPLRHKILIDDREQNCRDWFAAGGTAILHISAEQTIRALDWWEDSVFYDNAMPILFSSLEPKGLIQLTPTWYFTPEELNELRN